MIQQLIEWMEEESDKHFKHGTVQSLYGAGAIQRCIAKAKELQGKEEAAFKKADALKGEGWTPEEYFHAVGLVGLTEPCKWAVVHESAIFSDLEQAVKEKEDLGGIQSDYTIVKIIEP
jgi:hypothetical protein